MIGRGGGGGGGGEGGAVGKTIATASCVDCSHHTAVPSPCIDNSPGEEESRWLLASEDHVSHH